ncbi:MAG: thioredoxin-disulfide reductase [Clostridiales bacterium]|nr:thioredoxin-disulfide reductase [Clostridiales bacterium]
MYDLIIIGGGPAGMTAALYASRADLDVLLLERGVVGGQVINTYEVDNYPGFPKINGAELMMHFSEHVEQHQVDIRYEEVTDLELGDTVKRVRTYNGEYEAKAVLYCAGASPKPLGVPGEDTYRGRGVSYCATCDGAFFRGRTVAVVGGGDTAAEDAAYLARACKQVYVIVRKPYMRAAASLQRKLKELDNVSILFESVVREIKGDGMFVTELDLIRAGKEETLAVDGVFAAIGVVPETGLLKGKVDTCNQGFIATDEYMMTSIPGVFAAGDVIQKVLRQIITAAADGAVAVAGVLHYFDR